MTNSTATYSFSSGSSMARTLDYRVRLIDEITPNARTAQRSTEELNKSTEQTTKSADSLALAFIHNITVLSALREGVNGIVSSLYILEITGEKTNMVLRKMAAMVSLFIDTARAIKGVIALVEILTASEKALAVIESYRLFLKNPFMIGVGIAAAGTAVGVGGYLMGRASRPQASGTTVNQTLNFNAPGMYGPSTGAVKREALEGMGGY